MMLIFPPHLTGSFLQRKNILQAQALTILAAWGGALFSSRIVLLLFDLYPRPTTAHAL